MPTLCYTEYFYVAAWIIYTKHEECVGRRHAPGSKLASAAELFEWSNGILVLPASCAHSAYKCAQLKKFSTGTQLLTGKCAHQHSARYPHAPVPRRRIPASPFNYSFAETGPGSAAQHACWLLGSIQPGPPEVFSPRAGPLTGTRTRIASGFLLLVA